MTFANQDRKDYNNPNTVLRAVSYHLVVTNATQRCCYNRLVSFVLSAMAASASRQSKLSIPSFDLLLKKAIVEFLTHGIKYCV